MIAVNASIIGSRPTGLGIVAGELARRLAAGRRDVLILASAPHEFDGARVEPVPRWVRARNETSWGGMARFLWNQSVVPYKLWSRGATVLFSPNHEAALFCPCPQVVVIPDLLPLLYPGTYPRLRHYFRYVLPWVLRRCEAIIAISENTKKDLVKHYGLPARGIEVIYPGVDRSLYRPVPAGPVKKEPYILYVGSEFEYKNVDVLIDVFCRLARAGLPHDLVICGKRDPRRFPRLRSLVRRSAMEERVIFLDYLPKADLPGLYSRAELLVFPSSYEGFGLPLLEAMACGCPVASSWAASMPEVCGDAAAYFDPGDPEDMLRTVGAVLGDRSRLETMRRKGLDRSEKFDWSVAMEKYAHVLAGAGH